MPPSSRVRSDDSIGMWFIRASGLARAITSGCITIDEAAEELLATIRCASDVSTLRRAAWDAETVLGPESILRTLLETAAHQVATTGIRTT